ncbi:hypothetical protein VTP01DRAFT_2698 [Rhizomucor pusillus]|uniref:uncharacterized protein n=1 Tax=Rhizomucor pusillus TaxID=4840 RepID=UPI00374405AF
MTQQRILDARYLLTNFLGSRARGETVLVSVAMSLFGIYDVMVDDYHGSISRSVHWLPRRAMSTPAWPGTGTSGGTDEANGSSVQCNNA